MSSGNWHDSIAFEQHRTSRAEIAGLLAHADRCLADGSAEGISPETRHAATHNAAVYLAKAALAACGFRTTESHHYWMIESLRHTVGLPDHETKRLHAHRKKRHASSYEYDGIVSDTEVAEFLEAVRDLRSVVRGWLAAHHPDLA